MVDFRKKSFNKSFIVKEAIDEIISLVKLNQKEFIYSIKTDLPQEICITGNKIIFQGLLFKLLKNAAKNYEAGGFQNKIILITSRIEGLKKFSFSVTTGGKGLSFLEKIMGKGSVLVFRERSFELNIYQINKILKKEFGGHLKIISKKGRGSTFKCYFPLNQ